MSYYMIEENVGPGYITWEESYATKEAAQKAMTKALARMNNPNPARFRVQEYAISKLGKVRVDANH